MVIDVLIRRDVVPTQSSDSGASLEPRRVVTFVELLKRRSEPLGLVLKGTSVDV